MIGVDSGLGDLRRRQRRHQDRVAQFLVKLKTPAEVLEYSGAFLQLYREEAGTSSAPPLREPRGPDHVKSASSTTPRAAGRWARRVRPTVVPPDPWFEFDKAAVDTRQFIPVSAVGSGWKAGSAASRTSDMLGSRRVPRANGLDVAVFRNAEGRGVRAARPLPAQGRPAQPGHRLRPQRGLPAAQLDHRPVRRVAAARDTAARRVLRRETVENGNSVSLDVAG